MIDDCTQSPPIDVLVVDTAHAATIQQLRLTIRSLQDELIACQRLALLGSMTAMVTHEFNNLLTPIMARAEAALMGADTAYMRKTLDRTLIQSQRAMAVTKHLLALAHDNDVPIQDCILAEVVREAVDTLTRPCEKDGIDLQIAVPGELCVRARSELLCQLLLNLLLNARTAMAGMRGTLSISAVAEGKKVRIDVRDQGKGIPSAEIESRVNPFLRAKPSERPNDWQKTGLGLSVCRNDRAPSRRHDRGIGERDARMHVSRAMANQHQRRPLAINIRPIGGVMPPRPGPVGGLCCAGRASQNRRQNLLN